MAQPQSIGTIFILLNHMLRTAFGNSRYFEAGIANIIFEYQQPPKWDCSKPPRVIEYRILSISDKWTSQSMIGIVFYLCNGKDKFIINGIKCKSGDAILCKLHKLSNIKCKNDTLFDKAFKYTFGEDATKYNIISSTFMTDGNNYGPLLQCVGSTKMDYLKLEMQCIDALIQNWKLNISKTTVSSVIGRYMIEIECLPYDALRTAQHHGTTTDLFVECPELIPTLLNNYQNIYHNGYVYIKCRDFAILLKKEFKATIGLARRVYKIIQRHSLSTSDVMINKMQKLEANYQWMVYFKDLQLNSFLIDAGYQCLGIKYNNRDDNKLSPKSDNEAEYTQSVKQL